MVESHPIPGLQFAVRRQLADSGLRSRRRPGIFTLPVCDHLGYRVEALCVALGYH